MAPLLRTRLGKLLSRMIGDVPVLAAAWVVQFIDTPTSGTQLKCLDATLEQYGCFVIGSGHVHGEPGDPFRYYGIIRRNILYGSFKRKDANSLAGTGTFVLKIRADASEMAGQCSWYDNGIDAVWASEYLWLRNQHGQNAETRRTVVSKP